MSASAPKAVVQSRGAELRAHLEHIEREFRRPLFLPDNVRPGFRDGRRRWRTDIAQALREMKREWKAP